MNGCHEHDEPGVDQFATGVKEVSGTEGTWRDAEDGSLQGNPITKGSVDSTIGLHTHTPAHANTTVYYWIAAGKSFDDVQKINQEIRDKKPDIFIARTRQFWHLWANKEDTVFSSLGSDLVHMYKRILLVLRTQIDNDGGIIAATDYDIVGFGADSYCYVWPRDGVLVSSAFDMVGYAELTQRYFKFCSEVMSKDGYFLHKFNPDGSLASSWHPWYADGEAQLPIQEDGTGLVLWALWQHFDLNRDIEFFKPLYRTMVVRAANFLVSYRDVNTGLPLPSYDLWEERCGVFSFSIGAVYGGLIAASNFADIFGELDLASTYREAAATMKRATETYLWQDHVNRFVRMVMPKPDDTFDIDLTIDSSICGLFQFGMFSADDEKIVSTVETIRDRLWIKTLVGGVARYENDYYHQVSQDVQNVPGNPWFICTLWLAQYYIARAKSVSELAPGMEMIRWVVSRALPSGVLAEQVNPYTNAPMSVSPLTWSHAELVTTILSYVKKQDELETCPVASFPRAAHSAIRSLIRDGERQLHASRRQLVIPAGRSSERAAATCVCQPYSLLPHADAMMAC